MADLRFITDLNAEVYISVKGESCRGLQRAVLDALCAFGELGWQSEGVPADGCRFPPSAEPDIDRRPCHARREEYATPSTPSAVVVRANEGLSRVSVSVRPPPGCDTHH